MSVPAPQLFLEGSGLDGATINASLLESSGSGTLIGRITAPPGVSFTLLDDAGGTVFLDGNQLRRSAASVLDPDAGPLSVTFRVTDAGGQQADLTAKIGIDDDPAIQVRRGSAADDAFAPGAAAQQVFVGGAGNDTIHANDGDIVVLSGLRSDYDILVTLSAPDSDGLGGGVPTIALHDLRPGSPDGEDLVLAPSAVTFRFLDGDYSLSEIDSPAATRLALNGRVLEIGAYAEENGPSTTFLGQLSMRGRPESPQIVDYDVLVYATGQASPSVLTGNERTFQIDASGGVHVVFPLDYETCASYGLRVTYRDGDGTERSEEIPIRVIDVDDPPSLVQAPGLVERQVLSTFLDTSQDLRLGAIQTQDQDGTTGTLSFVLTGSDADKFFIRNGDLYLKAGTDLFALQDANIDIVLTLTDSALPDPAGDFTLQFQVVKPSPVAAITGNSSIGSFLSIYLMGGGVTVDDPAAPGQFVTLDWTPQQVAALQLALQQFEEVADLHFTFASSLEGADFALMAATEAGPGTAAYWVVSGGGQLGVDGTPAGLAGWGRLGLSNFPDADLTPGSYGFDQLLRILGFGLGLDSPHDTGNESVVMEGVTAPTGSYGMFGLNQGVFTVMTLNPGWPTGPNGAPVDLLHGFASGPGPLDIAALQGIYGANYTPRSGNDIYTLADANGGYLAIWDTGGTDRIRYVGSKDVVISLESFLPDYVASNATAISFVKGVQGGLTLAYGTLIEEAEGGAGNDLISGNAGGNRLFGRGGNDTLVGLDGNDFLLGGAGADRLDGGAGIDTAAYLGSAAGVRVDLALGLGAGGDAAGDVLIDIESLIGSANADRLSGSGAANLLDGRLGNDTLRGWAGDDTLIGGGGADLLVGGAGRDRVGYAASAAGVTVDLGAGTGLGGDAEGDRLVSVEDLVGSAFDDRLTGSRFANRLWGGAGADTLAGDTGSDVLSGGSGADAFVFDLASGRDRILDFSMEDRIEISSALWSSLGLGLVTELMTQVTAIPGGLALAFTAQDILRLDHLTLADLAALESRIFLV